MNWTNYTEELLRERPRLINAAASMAAEIEESQSKTPTNINERISAGAKEFLIEANLRRTRMTIARIDRALDTLPDFEREVLRLTYENVEQPDTDRMLAELCTTHAVEVEKAQAVALYHLTVAMYGEGAIEAK